jgi:hypothetical protein
MREHVILSPAVRRATLTGMQQPTMFCHDGTTIYYPTGPGRVHMIAISALYDCDGSDEDFSDSTSLGDLADMARAAFVERALYLCDRPPVAWPPVHIERNGDITEEADVHATEEHFSEAMEQWADWCDRDAARLDRFDGPAPNEDAVGVLARLRALVARAPHTMETLAQVVSAIGESQPAVAC